MCLSRNYDEGSCLLTLLVATFTGRDGQEPPGAVNGIFPGHFCRDVRKKVNERRNTFNSWDTVANGGIVLLPSSSAK